MAKRIDQIPSVTTAAGDKYVIYDASEGTVGVVDPILPMLGATASDAGTGGTVPAAAAGKHLDSFRGDGTYRLNDVKVTRYTSGTNSFTPDPNTVYAIVEVQGGGGGGCAAFTMSAATSSKVGSGGGGGAYVKAHVTKAQLGSAAISCVVGAGGTAGVAGGNSTFGSTITAGGGSNGTLSSETTSAVIMAGGNGSTTMTTSGCTVIHQQAGRDGDGAFAPAMSVGTSHVANGGSGGSSFLGCGGPSEAAIWGNSCVSIAQPATGFGAGGSGIASSLTSSRTGLAGTSGCIIIHEYR